MQPFDRITIYYFSGTGNSRNVARWICAEAEKKGTICLIEDLSRIDRLHVAPPAKGTMVVFISPVHGFNYPPVMLNFIARFPKAHAPVVLMNTRAGMRIGKWVTPGMSGIALLLSALILILKGYSIRGMFAADLPSNWISIHPGLNKRTTEYIHEKVKPRVRHFADKIFSGKRSFKPLLEIYDILLLPIAMIYYIAGRFILAKTFYASADCNLCGACIKNCPIKAIREINKRPFWTIHCESCMHCMSNCPTKAIETAHGMIIGYSVLISVLILPLYYHFATPYISFIHHPLVEFLAETALYLSLLIILYRIIHYLLRFRFMNKIMVFTSFTHYKFWGRRYKAQNDK